MVGEHVQGEAGLHVLDVLAEGSYEVGFRPDGHAMPEGGHIFQEEVSDSCVGRAGEDCVLEGLWLSPAAWAGKFWVLVGP